MAIGYWDVHQMNLNPTILINNPTTFIQMVTILWQLVNSQNIYDTFETYFQTKYYEHILRQVVAI